MPLKIGTLNQRLETKKAFRQIQEDLVAARSGILYNAVTYNLTSLDDALGATATVYVPGAELGDFAFASLGVSLQGITATAYVSAPDVVSVRFQNETTTAALDLASTTLRVFVVPRRSSRHVFGNNALYYSAVNDVTSLIDAAGATTSHTVTGAALGDYVFVSHNVDLVGVHATAYVQAADTVEVRFQNESGSTLDLASTARTNLVVIPRAYLRDAFFGKVLTGAATFDHASGADGVGETTTVTVTGAALGDYAFCSITLDAEDITITAYVSAANTVSVRFQNESTGTRNLGSVTLRAGVIPHGVISGAGVVGLTK